jgi:TonB family protein
VNDFHRVEIGTSNRIWKLDHTKDFPEVATRLPDLMNIFPSASTWFEFEAITDSPDQKPAEKCATTKPGSQQEQYRFCFDKQSGALLAKLSPEIRPKNMTDYVAVDAIGKPQNMTVSKSGGKRLDEAALEAARKWRFKPATCNGELIPAQINIGFNF